MSFIKQIKLHTKAVKECILMIENIEIYLSYNNLSINEIFNLLSNTNTFSELYFLDEINNNLKSENISYILSDDNIYNIKKYKYLNSSEKEDLIKFFSGLGKSDLNGQISNCKTYKEIFKKQLNSTEKDELTECKSMGTLIIGVGVLLIILIV